MNGESTRFLSGSRKAKQAGSAGGVKSGEVRRQKRQARTVLRDLLARPLPVTKGTEELLTEYGLDASASAQEVMLAALVTNAVRGDVKSIGLVLGIMGEAPEDRRHDDRMRLENQRLEIERKRAKGNEESQLANDWVNALLQLYDDG